MADHDSLKSGFNSTVELTKTSILPPLSAPLILFPQFVTNEAQEFTMQKKLSWTFADFDIKRDGQVVLLCRAKAKLGYEKEITTPAGELLMTIKTPCLSLTRKTTAYLPDGTPVLYIVRTNNSLKYAFRSPHLQATFANATTGLQSRIEVDAAMYQNKAEMLHDDQVIASIRTLRAFGGERTVTVAAGKVDWLLIIAICICFDMHVMELTGTHGGYTATKA